MMLALKRRVGERVKIGDCVELYVVKVVGQSVVLSFRAPPDVKIRRAEVAERHAQAALRNDPAETISNCG